MAIKKKFPYRSAVVACNSMNCKGNQNVYIDDKDKNVDVADNVNDYVNKNGAADGCTYGCIGCGACIEACRFDAIHLNESGVACVDEDKCIACGKCVRECPQKIIHIHECANYIVVRCSNKQKGKEARQVCPVSCIGCGICEKICTASAVHMVDNCAVIEEKYCLSCGMCAVKCPRRVIGDLRGILL